MNNTTMTVPHAMACLDFIWDEDPVMERLVNACLIQEALDAAPIELSDEELQVAMDGFRRAHRLYTGAETRRWMGLRGLNQERLENYVADQAVVAKLRQRIAEGQVQEYFEEYRADFDTARLARLDIPEEAHALRALELIRGGRLTFYEAAELEFTRGETARSSSMRSLLAMVTRREAGPEVADAVFAAQPGDVVGPLKTETGYAIMRVLWFPPPASMRQQERLSSRSCSTSG